MVNRLQLNLNRSEGGIEYKLSYWCRLNRVQGIYCRHHLEDNSHYHMQYKSTNLLYNQYKKAHKKHKQHCCLECNKCCKIGKFCCLSKFGNFQCKAGMFPLKKSSQTRINYIHFDLMLNNLHSFLYCTIRIVPGQTNNILYYN